MKTIIALYTFVGLLTVAARENFHGSETLLDRHCDEADYFIDAFTLSSEPSVRLTVEGSATDVTDALARANSTG